MKGMIEVSSGVWVNRAWLEALAKAPKPDTRIWDALVRMSEKHRS